jgi:hypothetical protein
VAQSEDPEFKPQCFKQTNKQTKNPWARDGKQLVLKGKVITWGCPLRACVSHTLTVSAKTTLLFAIGHWTCGLSHLWSPTCGLLDCGNLAFEMDRVWYGENYLCLEQERKRQLLGRGVGMEWGWVRSRLYPIFWPLAPISPCAWPCHSFKQQQSEYQ